MLRISGHALALILRSNTFNTVNRHASTEHTLSFLATFSTDSRIWASRGTLCTPALERHIQGASLSPDFAQAFRNHMFDRARRSPPATNSWEVRIRSSGACSIIAVTSSLETPKRSYLDRCKRGAWCPHSCALSGIPWPRDPLLNTLSLCLHSRSLRPKSCVGAAIDATVRYSGKISRVGTTSVEWGPPSKELQIDTRPRVLVYMCVVGIDRYVDIYTTQRVDLLHLLSTTSLTPF